MDNNMMHPYSIDIQERKNVLLFLAIISIVLSWSFYRVLDSYHITLPWYVESPSVLFFYGLLFSVFDRWAWKIFRKIGIVKTPNLNVKWKGYLKSSFDEHSAGIKATLEIFQDWTRIKIILNTEQSSSYSESASFVIEIPEEKRLSYQYINEPKPDAVKTMSIHRGTAILLFDEKEYTLIGEYYSGRDRQNFGSLYFKGG